MSTTMLDRWGVPVQGATPEGISTLDDAVESLLALAGDPVEAAEAAVAAAPDMALGQVYRAYLALYGTTADGVAQAAKLLASLDADTSPGTRLQGRDPVRRCALDRDTPPVRHRCAHPARLSCLGCTERVCRQCRAEGYAR